jgi:ribosomal protein L30E
MLDDIRKLQKSGKLVIGKNRVLRGLKAGSIKQVYMTSNIDGTTKRAIETYASMGAVDLKQLNIPNDELGVVCKKPFPIMVLGVE